MEALENASTNAEAFRALGSASKALKGAHDSLWVQNFTYKILKYLIYNDQFQFSDNGSDVIIAKLNNFSDVFVSPAKHRGT